MNFLTENISKSNSELTQESKVTPISNVSHDEQKRDLAQEKYKFGMQATSLSRKINTFNYGKPFLRFNGNQRIVDLNIRELDVFTSEFIETVTGSTQPSLQEDIHEFINYIDDNPASGHTGTTPPGSLLWLFLIARSLKPKVIVESGIYHGASLHCLRHAAPSSSIFAFDLSLAPLLFEDHSIQLWEKDWSEVGIHAKSDRDLCYFDDHINHGLRIRQAFERGFKNLIFDDAPFLGEIHQFRWPGLPTVPMIMNCQDGDFLQWQYDEEYLEYKFEEKDTYGAKNLIEFARPIPSHENFTSQKGNVQYFVRLK